MNAFNNNNNNNNTISEKKISHLRSQICKLRTQQEVCNDKINRILEKIRKEEEKDAKDKERKRIREIKEAEKEERTTKREIKKYISTADQLQFMSELDNETLIRMANNSEFSIENLLRIHGHRIQKLYPHGWPISTFKSTFIQNFGSMNWLQCMSNKENSISSVFYRMCPDSKISTSKITGKPTGIPSFVKVKKIILNGKICVFVGRDCLYLFDPTLYLSF